MRNPLRFWFALERPLDRVDYLVHGTGLMAIKFTVDVALVRAVAGLWWSPVDYGRAMQSMEQLRAVGAPPWLSWVMLLWMLPFVVIGATLTLRRTLDAGISPWFTTLFFVPVANYVLMAILSMLPTAEQSIARVTPRFHSKMGSAVRAIVAAAFAGVLLVAFGVTIAREYAGPLFIGTPFVMGATAAYWFNLRYPASGGDTRRVVMATFAAAFGGIVLLAIEGAICLLMALPVALVAGYGGAWVGRRLAMLRNRTPGEAMIAVLVLPLAMTGEPAAARDVQLHEVRSAIEIDAGPDVVWRNVVSFPAIVAPPDLLFRTGIAYPVGARIEGVGVGATRYCDFSTGSFIEPITVWDPGRTLAFDVVSQPPPMREWSPYRIAPPHLDGFFRARRGEFRIVPLADGRTRLEGSTWYDLRMAPERYWSWLAHALIARIHMRVLRHVRDVSEKPGNAAVNVRARTAVVSGAQQILDSGGNAIDVRQDGLEQYGMIRHRHVLDRQAVHGRVQIPESLARHRRGDLRTEAGREIVFMDHETSARLLDRLQHHRAIPRRDRSQIDDLDPLRESLRGGNDAVEHRAPGDDRGV